MSVSRLLGPKSSLCAALLLAVAGYLLPEACTGAPLRAMQASYLIASGNGSKSTPSSSQSYGEITDIVEKIETLLNNASTLTISELSDFQSRLDNLKRSAQFDLSRGSDAHSLIQPANSFHTEILARLRENASISAEQKRHLENNLVQLENLLNLKSGELPSSERERFQKKLTEIQSKAQEKASYDDQKHHLLMRESHDLEHSIVNTAMFRSRSSLIGEPETKSHATTSTDPLSTSSLSKSSSSPSASLFRESNESPGSSSNATTAQTPIQGQITEYGTATIVPNIHPAAPRKPMVSVLKTMEILENELIALHEKGRIGTFDMDAFTGRLLTIKKNWRVMVEKSGSLAPRQESILRHELEMLKASLDERINGSEK